LVARVGADVLIQGPDFSTYNSGSYLTNKVFRYAVTVSGPNYIWAVYVNENDVPVLSGTSALAAPTALGWRAGTATEYFLDLLYYTTQGAFSPSQLPQQAVVLGAGDDPCRIVERLHVLADAREPWSSMRQGRPFAAFYRTEWDPAYRRPFVFSWVKDATVKRAGMGSWLHEMNVLTWLALEDLDQPDVNRLGRYEEDWRAMLENQPALNELMDVHRGRVMSARKIAERRAYPYDLLEISSRVVVERRHAPGAQGTYAAGAPDPGEIAGALRTLIAGDAAFRGVKAYVLRPNQPEAWPAAFVMPGEDKVVVHQTGDHHWKLSFTVRFEERALGSTPSCTLYNRVYDLEDALQAAETLNGTRGVRNARVASYKHLFGDRAAYPYDAAEVMVEVETDTS